MYCIFVEIFTKMKTRLFLFGILFSTLTLSAQEGKNALQRFLSNNNLSSAGISVLVCEVENGTVIAEHQSKTNRSPASLVKLITTATAIEMLTENFRFQTRIEYDGAITADSVLEGNIYIVGGGDPTLESARRKNSDSFYSQSVKAIQKAGIRRISGRVIGDASLYDETGSPNQWLVEDVGSYYSPTPSALSIHDNMFFLTLKSDLVSVKLEKIQPFTPLLSPVLNFKIGGKEVSWRVSKSDFSWQPVLRGTMPADKQVTIRTEIPEPALFAADSLSRMLNLVGILTDSSCTTVRMYPVPDGERQRIFTYYSEPLKNIIKETNHQSNNLYAENIFNYLSLLREENVATSKTSASVVSSFWKERGVASQKIFQADGSGLSMKNAINADFFVYLLRYMKNKGKYGEAFVASLPTAGVSGTVSSFMAGTPLSGKAFVKSGSMERVQNYSGYIQYNDKWYAFCIMVNNYEGDRATVRKQMSDLLNGLFE